MKKIIVKFLLTAADFSFPKNFLYWKNRSTLNSITQQAIDQTPKMSMY